MFKRYKLRPKVVHPLKLRSKTVGVAKRISDEFAKILAMLKHSSSTVRMRGAREAEKMQGITEEMIRELMKMSQHEKKEPRALFYRVVNSLVAKALPTELPIWEEYLFLYLSTMATNTFADIRKDSLNLLDMVVKYFPEKTNENKQDLEKWLKNDEYVIRLDPKEPQWHKSICKRIEALRTLRKTKHASAKHTDQINMLHTHVLINNVAKKHFPIKEIL